MIKIIFKSSEFTAQVMMGVINIAGVYLPVFNWEDSTI